MAGGGGSEYHRRLDRSPETEEFTRLPHPDKELVSQLRSATEQIRMKLENLQEENEDKERDAAKEAALRKAIEERMDQLVDMYGDPAVTDELRQRLPRANKEDPLVKWKKELDEAKQKESLNPEVPTDSAGQRDHTRRSHSPPGSIPADRYPHYLSPPGLAGYYPNLHPPGFSSVPPPLYQASAPAIVYMLPQPSCMAATTSGSHAPAPGAPTMGQSSGPSQTSHTTGTSEAVSQTEQPQTATKDLVVQREQNRQIALLLAELDAARDLNKNLQQRLASTQHELESLKVSHENSRAAIETESSRKARALVEEIYKAQKEREEAIMSRLRLANEERDEALLKLRNLEALSIQGSHQVSKDDDYQDSDIKDILAQVESLDSSEPIKRRLIDFLNRFKQRYHQIKTEEMKAILEEKNEAVIKCNKLEADVLSLTRQLRDKTGDKQQVATLQARLLTAQQERDAALSRLKKMEEELQALKIFYGLHKSLSQEANLRDQFHNTLETYQSHIKNRDSVMDQAYKENNQLAAQLKVALAENVRLKARLTQVQNEKQQLENVVVRSEKVVSLLRQRAKEQPDPAEE